MSYFTTPRPLLYLPKQRIADLVAMLGIRKMATLPAHTKHLCFVSHIIVIQGSAHVDSSGCGNRGKVGRGKRRGGKGEMGGKEDASSFV